MHIFRQLSSCGHAFIVSLKRNLDRNRMYFYAISNGLPLPFGSVLQSQIDPNADIDFDELDEVDLEADPNPRTIRPCQQ